MPRWPDGKILNYQGGSAHIPEKFQIVSYSGKLSEKIYKVWSGLYLYIATRWPWGVTGGTGIEEEAATPVAPKRSRRQQPADARDVCYNLLML